MKKMFGNTFLASLVATSIIGFLSLFDFRFFPLIILVWIAFYIIIVFIDLPIYLIEKYIKK